MKLRRPRRPGAAGAGAASLPAGFDEDAYLRANPDVAEAVASGAMPSGAAHYEAFGAAEGRPLAGEPIDRVARVLATIDRDGLGLEVGPSHSPMAPKADGFRVHVLDHVDTETLRARYGPDGQVLPGAHLIEEVDFVWRGEPLWELVGGEAVYDWIIASHAIEHMPDLVAFLQGCERILRPGGRLALVVPDHRWCFDHWGVPSTTGALLDAHHREAHQPSPGQVWDHMSRACRLGDDIAWADGAPGRPQLMFDRARAADAWQSAVGGADLSGDLHLWRFTPESFRVVVDDLVGLGLIGLEIVSEHPTHGAEFWITLGRADAPAEPVPEGERGDLLEAAREASRR